MVWTPSFNRSVRVEARNERITGDSGAVSGREVLCRSRIVRWLAGRLSDARDPGRVRHPLASLLRTAMLLVAQGRRAAGTTTTRPCSATTRPSGSP